MERTRFPRADEWRRTLSATYGAGNASESLGSGVSMPLRSDRELRALLENTRTIAVLGIKAGEHEDAFRVPRYLQRAGFAIRPVSPKLREVLGERAVATLGELTEPVDMIDVFRAPAHIPAHVDEILAMKHKPKSVWLQLGIEHPATARLEAAGIAVVEDRCLMVEHARLFRRAAER
jgi:predicted CoA-binding protein